MDRTHASHGIVPSFSTSPSASPTNATVPSINIGGSPGSPGSPVNEFLGRSLDIKKQLSQSFHAHAAGPAAHSGGVSKPKSRRNSAYHVKSEDWDDEDVRKDASKEEQGVERKRRDNINDKIQELLTLIPAEYFQEAKEGAGKAAVAASASAEVAGSAAHEEAMAKAAGTRDGKPNKGQILTQAVEYIQHLQNSIDENNRKEVELFLKKRALERDAPGDGAGNVPVAVEPTSAEKALGEIGVGPESEAYFRKVLQEYSSGFKGDA